jgi:outer membrane biogenesis lipoprotein LolB
VAFWVEKNTKKKGQHRENGRLRVSKPSQRILTRVFWNKHEIGARKFNKEVQLTEENC